MSETVVSATVGICGGVMLLFLLFVATTTTTSALVSTTSLQRFYGLVGPALDLMSLVEDKPRNRALELANLQQQDCKSILEIGPGTGRTAQRILKANPQLQRYTGIELTPRMANLARSKVGGGENSNTIVSILEGNCLDSSLTWGGGQQEQATYYDRIVAFYVLDIFTKDQIQIFLQECDQCLSPNGKLVLVSITDPDPESSTLLSNLVMVLWTKVSNATPVLLGGCRPIQLASSILLLGAATDNNNNNGSKPTRWKLEHCEQMSVLGYTSEIVIASRD